ncbi:MAG: ATP-binding protein [Myxococcaceae bacterium]
MPSPRPWFVIVGIALGYFVLAQLALQLALPPGYAVPIWPAAGVALATYLMRGRVALWGVLLGATFANVHYLDGRQVLTAFLVACGSTAQTWLIGWVLQRWLGKQFALDSVGQLARFFLVCVAGSVIAASVAVGTLYAVQGLSPSMTLINALTWWFGDALGMITFTPLVLLFRSAARAEWQSRRLAAGGTIFGGFAICLVAFFVVKSHDREQLDAQYRQEAQLVVAHVDAQLSMAMATGVAPPGIQLREPGARDAALVQQVLTRARQEPGLAVASAGPGRIVAALVTNGGAERVAAVDLDAFLATTREPAERHLVAGTASEGVEATAAGVRAAYPVTLGGEAFTLTTSMPHGSLPQGLLSWLVLALCMVVSATIGGLALVLSGRTMRVEALVTERTRQLEAARDDAQRASDAKTRFLATVSHELRTPLHGVLGTVSILGETSLTPEQRHLLGVMHESGQSLLSLLNDVLDMSRIEAGRFELDVHRFATRSLLEATVGLFESAAEAKGLTLSLAVERSVPEAVVGDALRLKQVVGNLVANAVKFTSAGSVGVTARWRQGLEIEVADTGPGIAPDVAARLFRPFEQADSSTTRRFGGTGLGLAICRSLAELMNGTIALDSTPGRGSTFTVRVPLERSEVVCTEQKPSTQLAVAPKEGVRVLVAEDNPTNQLIVRRFLEQLGVDAHFVTDGRAAVDAVGRQGFDVVLMDLHMPELDGLAASREIRALSLARQPRIFALTADAYAATRDTCIAAGMDGFLAKPLHKATLAQALSA